MSAKTTLAASVHAQKGRLYVAIQTRENGKPKTVWRALKLPDTASKTQVQKAYR